MPALLDFTRRPDPPPVPVRLAGGGEFTLSLKRPTFADLCVDLDRYDGRTVARIRSTADTLAAVLGQYPEAFVQTAAYAARLFRGEPVVPPAAKEPAANESADGKESAGANLSAVTNSDAPPAPDLDLAADDGDEVDPGDEWEEGGTDEPAAVGRYPPSSGFSPGAWPSTRFAHLNSRSRLLSLTVVPSASAAAVRWSFSTGASATRSAVVRACPVGEAGGRPSRGGESFGISLDRNEPGGYSGRYSL